MTNTVDTWFDELAEPQGRLLSELRELIHDTDSGFVETLKWGQPCYSLNHLVCYLQKAKGHVVIGFQHGANLADTDRLLVGEGKTMRHVKIGLTDMIDREGVRSLIRQAIEFDCR